MNKFKLFLAYAAVSLLPVLLLGGVMYKSVFTLLRANSLEVLGTQAELVVNSIHMELERGADGNGAAKEDPATIAAKRFHATTPPTDNDALERLQDLAESLHMDIALFDLQGQCLWNSAKPMLLPAAIPPLLVSGQMEAATPAGGRVVLLRIPLAEAKLDLFVARNVDAVYGGLKPMRLIFLILALVMTISALASSLNVAHALGTARQKSAELEEKNRGLEYEVNARLSAEDALAKSRQEFHNLVQNTSDWFWETDAAGTIAYSSPRVADLLACWPEDVVGKNLRDLVAPEEQENVDALFRRMGETLQPFAMMDVIFQHKDLGRILLESSGTPVIDPYGQVAGVRGTCRARKS